MKKMLMVVLMILSTGQVFAQTDKHGNPVFNSVITNETAVDNILLTSNYYTLKNNIENKRSSVFISDKPTLDQIEQAALTLASDFFILTRDSKMVMIVMLQNGPKRTFTGITMATHQQSTFPCKLRGDITENRAVEIVREKYDPDALIENGKLKFNGKEFVIISNNEIEEAVQSLIKKEKLEKIRPSTIMMRSRNELKTYILSASQENGELDFFTEIKGKEFNGVQIKPGLFTTQQSIALYKWGRACFDIGVNTVEDAWEIFAEHQGKPVNDRDKDYIRMGFNREWEK